MADESPSKLEVAFARFEGVVSTKLQELSHDVKDIRTVLQAHAELFMPRREGERLHRETVEVLTRHDAQLSAIEKEQVSSRERQNKLILYGAGFGTLVGGLVSYLGRKFGITS